MVDQAGPNSITQVIIYNVGYESITKGGKRTSVNYSKSGDFK